MLTEIIIGAFVFIIILIISALPLYLAVKMLGGKTTIFKTILVNILGGIIVYLVNHFFTTWGGLIAFILLIWFYREMFRLKWFKALLAWLLQLIFMAILYAILAFLGLAYLISIF